MNSPSVETAATGGIRRTVLQAWASILHPAVIVSALGYFVDVFDLLLFSIVRVPSLSSLGVQGDALVSNGIFVLNCQMAGLLMGGIVWGRLGDKRGRVRVLFGSILLYSCGNIANSFVHEVWQYALIRFITGFGLAGELGAGITLVSEILDKEMRGYGTVMIATIGVAGAIAAGFASDLVGWRSAYAVGGALGLALLIARVSVAESQLFKAHTSSDIRKGSLRKLFATRERALRFIRTVLVGVPIWYAVGIVVTFSPEIGLALGMSVKPLVGRAVMISYTGLIFGDLFSGLLSQYLRSRKTPLALFSIAGAFCWVVLLSWHAPSHVLFDALLASIGFASGCWALVVTTSAEQFGTNLRATVATMVPNLIRGAVIPMTLTFDWLRPQFGIINAALLVGAFVFALAAFSLVSQQETFGRDLDFIEH